MRDILGAEKAAEIANLPEEDINPFKDYPMDELYELIYNFYKEKGHNIEPEMYGISTDLNTYTTRTTLGRPEDTSVEIDGVKVKGMKHSHYTEDALESAQIDIDSSWNGDSAGITYGDGEVGVFQTDYYTAATFSQLLYLEAVSAYEEAGEVIEDVTLSDMPLRNQFLDSYEHFCRPDWVASEGAIGGVVIANDGDDWKIILGRRSTEPRVNPGLISIAPNGGMSCDNLTEGGFMQSLERQFSEEFFQGKYEMDFFNDYVYPYQVSAGWNLRDGTFALGYMLLVKEQEGYKKLVDRPTHNFEFEELIEIDVSEPKEIANTVNISKMSPSTIPVVYRALVAFGSLEETPELEYEVLTG